MCKLFPRNIDYRIVLNYMMFNSSLENCGGFAYLSKLWCFLLSFRSYEVVLLASYDCPHFGFIVS